MNFGAHINLFDCCFDIGPLGNITTDLYLKVNTPLQSQNISIVYLQVCGRIIFEKDIYYNKRGVY